MNTNLFARTNASTRPGSWLPFFLTLVLPGACVGVPLAFTQVDSASTATDTDGDGLSDFQEQHKYLTNPNKSDSDGDGIADGDWRERREYQYTIRSVVQVMRPVTIDYLNDDYQDARILDETETFVELEVIHYPFNTVASAIEADNDWRKTVASMKDWVHPGPSSDWTPAMQKQLKAELLKDKIDIDRLNDRQIVERVSKWLCDRANYNSGFTSFVTGWDEDGRPFVSDKFMGTVNRKLKEQGLTLQQQWEREVSASGMYREKVRGSCTSSAIYLNGCMKATGIPTRTILCIPIIDASDEREFELLQNISQPGVRKHLLDSLTPLKQSWASHTFNEAYVGKHWHRLNYSRLGQGTYDRQLFGLLTHVATFNDWADARFYRTVGRRQKTDGPKDIFGFRNPYSTISLRDQVGVHCKVEIPKAGEHHLSVQRTFWTDDPDLDAGIRDACKESGRFGIVALVSGVEGTEELLEFLELCDVQVKLTPKDAKRVAVNMSFDAGCCWVNNDTAYIFVSFSGNGREQLARNVEYLFEPSNQEESNRWKLPKPLSTIRKKKIPN